MFLLFLVLLPITGPAVMAVSLKSGPTAWMNLIYRMPN